MKRIACILLSTILVLSTTGCNKSTPSTQGGTWTCNVCNKTDNTGNFCGECGESKPDNSGWTCQLCNTKGNTGKFCSNCGTPKDKQAGITDNKPVESSSWGESSSIESSSKPESSSIESSSSKPESSSSKPEARPSGSAGTLENPAKVGEWLTCVHYNTVIDDYQEMDVKITRVLRGAEAQKALDAYNETRYSKLECEIAEGTELCAVYFDIRYPETWVEDKDRGRIYLNIPNFSTCGSDGLFIKHNGVSMFSTVRNITISDNRPDIHPGDTVTDCVMLFAMFKDFDDYLFEIGSKSRREAYVRGA